MKNNPGAFGWSHNEEGDENLFNIHPYRRPSQQSPGMRRRIESVPPSFRRGGSNARPSFSAANAGAYGEQWVGPGNFMHMSQFGGIPNVFPNQDALSAESSGGGSRDIFNSAMWSLRPPFYGNEFPQGQQRGPNAFQAFNSGAYPDMQQLPRGPQRASAPTPNLDFFQWQRATGGTPDYNTAMVAFQQWQRATGAPADYNTAMVALQQFLGGYDGAAAAGAGNLPDSLLSRNHAGPTGNTPDQGNFTPFHQFLSVYSGSSVAMGAGGNQAEFAQLLNSYFRMSATMASSQGFQLPDSGGVVLEPMVVEEQDDPNDDAEFPESGHGALVSNSMIEEQEYEAEEDGQLDDDSQEEPLPVNPLGDYKMDDAQFPSRQHEASAPTVIRRRPRFSRPSIPPREEERLNFIRHSSRSASTPAPSNQQTLTAGSTSTATVALSNNRQMVSPFRKQQEAVKPSTSGVARPGNQKQVPVPRNHQEDVKPSSSGIERPINQQPVPTIQKAATPSTSNTANEEQVNQLPKDSSASDKDESAEMFGSYLASHLKKLSGVDRFNAEKELFVCLGNVRNRSTSSGNDNGQENAVREVKNNINDTKQEPTEKIALESPASPYASSPKDNDTSSLSQDFSSQKDCPERAPLQNDSSQQLNQPTAVITLPAKQPIEESMKESSRMLMAQHSSLQQSQTQAAVESESSSAVPEKPEETIADHMSEKNLEQKLPFVVELTDDDDFDVGDDDEDEEIIFLPPHNIQQ